MDRSEVEIPYRGGPLDGQRELLERWELEEGGDASDGDVYEHREHGSTEPAERYRLTYVDRHTGWEYRYVGSEGP